MIAKPKAIPLYIQQLEALIRRIPVDHPSRFLIEESLMKNRIGFKGEKAIEFYLGQLSENKYIIFHDLRLTPNKGYFQIDILLLSKCFILIIEVKNISGTLFFDNKFNQMIRIREDKREERFQNPLTQVKHQKDQLCLWLNKFELPLPPIETQIVNSNPKTILKTSSDSFFSPQIIHSEDLLERIKQIETLYPTEFLTNDDCKNISDLLLSQNTELMSNILKKFNMNQDELLPGVLCPNCTQRFMEKRKGRWHCNDCNSYSKESYLLALKDYALLISQEFTNQEIRKFLGLSSSHVTKRLLTSANLAPTGMKKGRKYHLDLSSFRT